MNTTEEASDDQYGLSENILDELMDRSDIVKVSILVKKSVGVSNLFGHLKRPLVIYFDLNKAHFEAFFSLLELVFDGLKKGRFAKLQDLLRPCYWRLPLLNLHLEKKNNCPFVGEMFFKEGQPLPLQFRGLCHYGSLGSQN